MVFCEQKRLLIGLQRERPEETRINKHLVYSPASTNRRIMVVIPSLSCSIDINRLKHKRFRKRDSSKSTVFAGRAPVEKTRRLENKGAPERRLSREETQKTMGRVGQERT